MAIPIIQRVQGRTHSIRPLSPSDFSEAGRIVSSTLDNTASALERASQAIYRSEELSRIADRQQREYAIKSRVREMRSEYANRKGTNAASISFDVKNSFPTFMEEQLEGVTNNKTRVELEGFLYDQQSRLSDWAFDYVQSQTQKAVDAADDLTFQDAQAEVNSLIAGDIAGVISIRDEALLHHAELGHPPEAISNIRNKYTDSLISDAFDKWYSENPQTAATAWNKNKDVLKDILSTKVYVKKAEQYDTEMRYVRLDNAKIVALGITGNDYQKASELILTPEFAKNNGLNTQEQSVLYNFMTGVHRNRIAENDRKRTESDRASLEQVVGKLFNAETGDTDIEGAMALAQELNRRGVLSASTYLSARDNINRANWEVDKTKFGSVALDAAIGNIDEVGVLNKFLEGGLGKDLGFLIGLVRQVKSDREKDGKVLNYVSLASDAFDEFVRQNNKKGKKDNLPTFQDRGDFLYTVLLKSREKSGRNVTAYDPVFLDTAQEMLKQGYWGGVGLGNTEGFREEGQALVVGEKKGTAYDYEKATGKTATSGSQTMPTSQLTQWDNDPAAIPGDTPEDALESFVTEYESVYGKTLTEKQRQDILFEIRAAREAE